MSKTLSFNLQLKSIPVEIIDPQGVPKKYTLVELNGKQRDTYLDEMGTRMTFDEKGKPKGLTSFAGMQAVLISLSLKNENGQYVSKEEVTAWPATAQTALFEAAQELSSLGEKKDDAAKNDQPASA